MDNIFIKAIEVQLGDNVWEHNIVTSMKREGGLVLFNMEGAHSWSAKVGEQVMVTNRPKPTAKSGIEITHEEASIVLTALREVISTHDYPMTDSPEFNALLKKVYEFSKVDGNPY